MRRQYDSLNALGVFFLGFFGTSAFPLPFAAFGAALLGFAAAFFTGAFFLGDIYFFFLTKAMY